MVTDPDYWGPEMKQGSGGRLSVSPEGIPKRGLRKPRPRVAGDDHRSGETSKHSKSSFHIENWGRGAGANCLKEDPSLWGKKRGKRRLVKDGDACRSIHQMSLLRASPKAAIISRKDPAVKYLVGSSGRLKNQKCSWGGKPQLKEYRKKQPNARY